MVNDLRDPITAQFKGTISDIHPRDHQIAFTETLFIGGQTINTCHSIPATSIVVVEGSLLLQDAWLKAGIATLLIPQMSQEIDSGEKHSLKYSSLLQVHKIQVVTSEWNYKENSENPVLSSRG